MTTDLYFRIERLEEENRALLKENAKLEGIIQGKDELLKNTLLSVSKLVLNSRDNPRYKSLDPRNIPILLSHDILNVNNQEVSDGNRQDSV